MMAIPTLRPAALTLASLACLAPAAQAEVIVRGEEGAPLHEARPAPAFRADTHADRSSEPCTRLMLPSKPKTAKVHSERGTTRLLNNQSGALSMTRTFLAATAAVLLAGAAPPAVAGSCPEEHRLTEPREIDRIGTKWLTREVIANVQLEGWREMGGFVLRQRRLELAPGGTVPTHSHADRPAIVYLAKGTVTEHNSFCTVPIVHHAGSTSEEFGTGFVHYWENTGSETATFISTDVVPVPVDGTPFYGWEGGVSPEQQYGG